MGNYTSSTNDGGNAGASGKRYETRCMLHKMTLTDDVNGFEIFLEGITGNRESTIDEEFISWIFYNSLENKSMKILEYLKVNNIVNITCFTSFLNEYLEQNFYPDLNVIKWLISNGAIMNLDIINLLKEKVNFKVVKDLENEFINNNMIVYSEQQDDVPLTQQQDDVPLTQQQDDVPLTQQQVSHQD